MFSKWGNTFLILGMFQAKWRIPKQLGSGSDTLATGSSKQNIQRSPCLSVLCGLLSGSSVHCLVKAGVLGLLKSNAQKTYPGIQPAPPTCG